MSKSDYYAEEKTLAAPPSAAVPSLKKKATTETGLVQSGGELASCQTPQRRMGGGDKLYGKELRDFDDNDIESLLSNLTTDELEDLNNDFDPDNSMLPPSQRCRDQTDKEPTGPYQRDQLLKYLEDSAKNEKDWEEVVPFNKGIKRGKVFEPKDSLDDDTECGGERMGIGGEKKRKSKNEMQMPIELDLDDEEEDEEEYEEEELEQALDSAPERDLVDLAGILGMHNVLNQPQYYNALKGKNQDENTGTSFNGVIKAYQPRMVPDEPDNETDVEGCIRRLEANDQSLEEVNINNMKRVSKERIRSLIRAAFKSKYLKKLCLANTAIADSEARPLIELLEESPSLKVLNIESNFISPELIARLLRATLEKQALVEFHAENQRASVLGNQIEMDIMLSVEDNDSLLRSMEARHRVAEALERNYERLRLKRLEEKQKH